MAVPLSDPIARHFAAMNQPPPGTPPREASTPDATTTAAKIALVGTIMAAIIGATATITAALVSRDNPTPTPMPPAPTTSVNASPTTSPTPVATPTTPTSAATSTTPAMPDGVTYQCDGSAPAGINITYGPSGSGLQATSLPFTAHDDSVSQTAQCYAITAQLQGGGDVTCTVTAAGHVTTRSGTARGGYNEATPEVCSGGSEVRWYACG